MHLELEYERDILIGINYKKIPLQRGWFPKS